MTRTAKADRTLTAQEQTLIRHYVREGATEDKIPRAARKMKMPVERAQTILRRIHVAAEVTRRRHLIEFEQARLDAQDINRKENRDEERIQITENRVFSKLNDIIDTDPAKLTDGHRLMGQFLKLALVVTGTIRDGRTERLIPVQGGASGGPAIYRSVFQRRQEAEAAEPEAADLYPPEPLLPVPAAPAPKPDPAQTEPPASAAAKPETRPEKILEVPVPRRRDRV